MQASLQPDYAEVQTLLPESVQQITGLIGFPATEALIRHFGGVPFRICKELRGAGAAHYPAAGSPDALTGGAAAAPFWWRGAVYPPL
ncbi:MAG: hypothetical protein ACR5LG_03235 [Sodalis sp. (in: enterobacteria)]|uniref:hypothetical protein n=1 Tax=Sodalis sp. (in: enterobacteria) TaxID=1898979 RepID=UPI003F3A5BB4